MLTNLLWSAFELVVQELPNDINEVPDDLNVDELGELRDS